MARVLYLAGTGRNNAALTLDLSTPEWVMEDGERLQSRVQDIAVPTPRGTLVIPTAVGARRHQITLLHIPQAHATSAWFDVLNTLDALQWATDLEYRWGGTDFGDKWLLSEVTEIVRRKVWVRNNGPNIGGPWPTVMGISLGLKRRRLVDDDPPIQRQPSTQPTDPGGPVTEIET